MRWPRLKRRDGGEGAAADPATMIQPGSWGQSAVPVPEPGPASAPSGNVAVISSPPANAEAAVVAPPPPPPPPLVAPPPAATLAPVASASAATDEGNTTGVRLGFADGSDIRLDPEDPHTLALKAIADVLVHKGPFNRPRH